MADLRQWFLLLLAAWPTDQEGKVLGPVVEASGPTADWHAGYVIALLQVTPFPLYHDELPPPEAYAVMLLVTAASPTDSTPTPTAQAAGPFPTDSAGLPLLCVSERVLTQRLAGATNESPAQLTPPVAATTLTDEATARALCEALVGADFHPVEASDLTTVWPEFLPTGATYWLWEDSGPMAASG